MIKYQFNLHQGIVMLDIISTSIVTLFIISCFLNVLLISRSKRVNRREFEELKRKNREIEIEKNLIQENSNNLNNENEYLKNKNIILEKENAVLKSEKNNLEKELIKKEDYDDIKLKNIDYIRYTSNLQEELDKKKDYDKIKADNLMLTERIEQQKKDIEKIKAEMEANFKNLANEILKQQKTDFTEEQNNIFKPFKEQIVELKNKIEENNKISNENKTRFEEQMKHLGDRSERLEKEAKDLTEALKGNKKIQGNWGEFQLDNLLQISGLEEGIDYTKQEMVEDGKRPDFIINLPDNRRIVVDSKVSLNNYINYVSTENEEEKKIYLNKYVNDIKNHIKELSDKEYNKKLKETLSLDYVLMFVPLERGYIDAIDSDNSIYKYSFERKVFIVTPSSLMSILITVGNIWNVEKHNKNIEEIIKKAESLCKKIYGFEESMNKVESGLKTADVYFKEAKGRLLEGSGNVIKTAGDIVKLGGIKLIETKQGRKRVKKVENNDDNNIIDGDIINDDDLIEN